MAGSSYGRLAIPPITNNIKINDYLTENGNDSTLQIDPFHGMTPLHMLSMNSHAHADSIASLLNSNMEAFFVWIINIRLR